MTNEESWQYNAPTLDMMPCLNYHECLDVANNIPLTWVSLGNIKTISGRVQIYGL